LSYPIENLPYGVFLAGDAGRIGVAIGDDILDLHKCASQNLLPAVCKAHTLNPIMAAGRQFQRDLRARITDLLAGPQRPEFLVPQSGTIMLLPCDIGDYTDFYASIHHATRVGQRFRPENPLLPNYRAMPIAYHGRSSSIVVSGTPVKRPTGQTPEWGPTRKLDFELELGFFIGAGNHAPVLCAEAEEHLFGVCLLNDWSARDIQAWEYQPLGPFLAKNFATTISPWVVTVDALEPCRVEPEPHETLPYLQPAGRNFDIQLEVWRNSDCIVRGNAQTLFWTISQMIAHHTSNGCPLRAGDLFGSGTISGENFAGCLLEMESPFLEDGEEIILRAYCGKPGLPRISFGECRGQIRT
jgi:fumarylacetoacetase